MKYKKCFLIAPSGNIGKINLILAKKRLKKLGFNKIFYRKDIFSKYLSYAGDYMRRSKEINKAYSSKTDIIFAVIGGQGAVHLLPYISYDSVKKSKKIIIGFSDITLLLNVLYKKTKARCLHGPNIGKNNSLDKMTLEIMTKAINRENYEFLYHKNSLL